MRFLSSFLLAALLFYNPALASDDHDCEYWRLGKDDAEKASWQAACSRIIANQNLESGVRARAYASRADWESSNDGRAAAIADFDKALELAPGNAGWIHDRAFLLYFTKQFDRAIKDFDILLAVKPDAHMTAFRGYAYLDKGDDAHGFADLASAIALEPKNFRYPYQRAVELAKRGKRDEALTDLNTAISLKADEADPYLLRAEIRDKRGETDEAIADLTRVAEISPKSVSPYMNRANIYERLGQLDRAIADYDTLLSIQPGDRYFTERKTALLKKLAARTDRPAPVAPAAAPIVEPPQAPVANTPEPEVQKPAEPEKKAETPAGNRECRHYSAIANRTISVPCPD